MDDHYLKTELYDLFTKSGEMFEFLQMGSLDGVWYWDLETEKDEWMSPRFWTLLGFDPSKKKHLASEWQDLIFPQDLEVALDNFAKHCADPNHPYDQVVRYHHKNGSTVWVRCRGIVIRNEAGKPIRMLGAHTDVTAQKEAEESLEKKNRELEEVNVELNRALAEIRTLQGLLPICAHCKSIRDDQGLWRRVEAYLAERTDATFTHGLCPDCIRKLYPNTVGDVDGQPDVPKGD